MSGRIRINWHNFIQSVTVVAVTPTLLGFAKKDAVRGGLGLRIDLMGCVILATPPYFHNGQIALAGDPLIRL